MNMINPQFLKTEVKLLVTVILTLQFFVATPLLGQFRNTKWGMTSNQVVQTENLNCPTKSSEWVKCQYETIYDVSFTVGYNFNTQGLFRGKYIAMDEPGNYGLSEVNFKNTFDKIVMMLEEKYKKEINVKQEEVEGKTTYIFELNTSTVKISGWCSIGEEVYYGKQMAIVYTSPSYIESDKIKGKL